MYMWKNSTLICMLVISFFSSLRRFWLPTGISRRKGGQFWFLSLQGQYIYNYTGKEKFTPWIQDVVHKVNDAICAHYI